MPKSICMFTEKPAESPENTRDSRKNETVIFDKNGRCELMQFNKKYKQTANVIDFSVRMTIMKLVNRTVVFNCFPDAWNVQEHQTTGNKRKRKYSANAQESNQKRPSIANEVFCDF